MTGVSEGQLVRMALNVLEDAAAQASCQPVRRNFGIRLALAYLASRRKCERWPFDTFWRDLEVPVANDRRASLNAALNGVYVQLGVRRELKAVSHYERDARKRLGRKGSEERSERNWGGDKGRG